MEDLRHKAEELLNLKDVELSDKIEDVKKLMHELRVYQIELELQNQQMQEYTDELKRAERMFFTLFNYAPVSYFLFDFKGVILDCNLKASELLVYNKSTLIGKPMVSYIAGGRKAEFYTFLDDVMKANALLISEFQLINAARIVIDLELHSVFIQNEFILTAAVDVTERNKQNLFLKEVLAKVEKSDKLKTDFLNNISHEIRTPLNAISGFSELICKENATTDKRMQYAKSIKSGSKQLIHIVEDILIISRLSSDDIQTTESSFSLTSLIADIQGMYKMKYAASPVKFEIQSLYSPLIGITSDYEKLLNIFDRLLDNAFKFTSIGKIVLTCKSTDEDIIFSVKDSGKGIDEESRLRIFSPFVKVNEHSRFHSGLGLGLSIAKGYALLLNAKIWHENHADGGSIFYFSIPLKKQFSHKSQVNYLHKNSLDIVQKTILIAEDERLNYELLYEIFSNFGAEILFAENGEKAVEIFLQSTPDIVILDLNMPVMDGFEAAKRIKKTGIKTKLVALTAHVNTVQEIDKSIFDTILFKPIDIDFTMKRIGNLLNL